jgi:hypothetical protein
MKIRRALLALAVPALLLAVPAASFAAAGDAQVAALVQQSGKALHVSAMRTVHVVHLKGKTTAVGLSGTAEGWNEIGAARSSTLFSTPPLSGGSGWDGKESWNLDQTGLVIVDAGDLGRSAAISQAFVGNDNLWAPNFGGASVAWGGTKIEKGSTYDVLTIVAPGSKAPFDLWFDRTTHFPVKMVQVFGPIVSTTTFSDYRSAGGLIVPFETDTTNNQGNSSTFTATSSDVNPADADARLAKPTSSPHDFSIANGATQTSVPIRLAENHVYLDVMLNGKGPYHFIFDTGGANIVDPAVAKEIGATSSGSMQINGVGSQTEGSSFAVVKTLQVGDAKVTDQVFAVLPVRKGFGVTAGQSVDGLIGYEVLSRFITTFDYAGKQVIFQMPGTFTAPPGASVVPISQNGTQPQFACSIDGVPTVCTLDTGARDSLTLYTPFMKSNPQVVPAKLSAIGVNGFGVGGPALGKLGRTQTLSFGKFTLPNLIGDYSTQTEGALAVPFLGANVGGGVWRRFTMTLDYNALTMTLTPNDAFDAPDAWDRSGVFLLNNGTVTIIDVRPGTPAARAGLTKGDAIVSVNGSPTSSMTLQAIRAVLIGQPGNVVHLVVKSKDGTTRNVNLTLADYV